MIKRVLLLVLLYGWLLGPRLKGLDLMWLTVGACLLVSPLVGGPGRVLAGRMLPVWLAAVCLLIYSGLVAQAHLTFDFGYAAAWAKAFIYAVSGAAVVLLYRRVYADAAEQRLLRDLIVCGAVSAVISLVIYTSPSLRMVISERIIGTIANSYSGLYGVRVYDLSIGGGTAYGLFNLILALVLYTNRGLFAPRWRAALLALLAVIIFLSARGVFVVSVLMALGALAANFRFMRAMRWLMRSSVAAVLIGVGAWGAVSSGALASVMDSEQIDAFFEYTVPWAFEIFLSAAEGEGLRSTTTDHIANEFFFPETPGGLMFGMGDSDPLSDSGLVRTVFAVGLLGFAAHIGITLAFLRRFYARVHAAQARSVMLGTALLLLVFNFKEIIFSNSRGLFGLFVLLYYGYLLLQPPPPPKAEAA
jgi:hypothetical protein